MTHEQYRECQLVVMDTFRAITVGYGFCKKKQRKWCGSWTEEWRSPGTYTEQDIQADMRAWVEILKMDKLIMRRIAAVQFLNDQMRRESYGRAC
jgi:hypothetical protein